MMKEDRISQLPDSLICHILYHLPTNESVKTMVLSTRWKNLWLWVPSLELSSQDFPDLDAFLSFGDRFFDSNRVACLQKLKLTIYEDVDVSYLTAWIDAAAKRRIQHLDFSGYIDQYGDPQVHTTHLMLYKCETLVHLRLSWVIFDDAEFLSFPCLETMFFHDVLYPNYAAFEKLVSRCPVLEELDICFNKYDHKGFQVHSQSLKRLTLDRESEVDDVPGIVIDAPLLCSLSISDDATRSIIVNNWESNAKLSISLLFGFNESTRSNIRNFLSGILRVGDLTIDECTFKSIFQYSKVEPLPQFCFMSRLNVDLYPSSLKCLPTFLESCPNLKSLVLIWEVVYKEMSQMSFSSVPKCLQSSLEFIEILVPTNARAVEMKIVSYFLENSAILKKFTLRLEERLTCRRLPISWAKKYIREELPKIPRGSTTCEVIVETKSKEFYGF